MNQAIILDLFSTLARSSKNKQAIRYLSKQLERDNSHYDKKTFRATSMLENYSIDKICEILEYKYKSRDIEIFDSLLDEEIEYLVYNEELIEFARLYSGKVALLSNVSQDYSKVVDEITKRVDFDQIVLSYELSMLKPDPQIFMHTCKRLDVSVSEATMYGDSQLLDIDGAINAGLSAIRVDYFDTHKIKK